MKHEFSEGRRKKREINQHFQKNQRHVEERAALREAKQEERRIARELTVADESLRALALQLPNMTHPSSPIGGYSASRVVRTIGPSIPGVRNLSAPPTPSSSRDHLSIAKRIGWIDMSSGVRTTGPNWPFLLGPGALLELAIANYALSRAIAHGFIPTLAPDVVKATLAERCGFAPRDGDARQTYFLSDDHNSDGLPPDLNDEKSLALSATAEIPLAGYLNGAKLSSSDLPLKMVALGRAFRAEAGARGKESRGLYRVHQFSKVELFVACEPSDSDRMLEELVKIQEDILGGLGLPLR
jgi:seryl-tRNA synthetase